MTSAGDWLLDAQSAESFSFFLVLTPKDLEILVGIDGDTTQRLGFFLTFILPSVFLPNQGGPK